MNDVKFSGAGDVNAAAERLSSVIRFETISRQTPAETNMAPFAALHDFLRENYPLTHAALKREVVSDCSLIYTWEGSEPGLNPVLLAAHQDVVPIADGTVGDWTHPPFSGAIKDGFIWGRGTLDCKGEVIAIMESVENLLAGGFVPKRGIILAFGQDEEVGGYAGAREIAKLLESRGVRAEWVVDEGGFVADGKPLGIKKLMATIGVAEKGYLSVELRTRATGGHSSMPPAKTAIGTLAKAIARLEENPFPPRMCETVKKTFEHLAPEMPPAARLLAAAPAAAVAALKLGLVKDNVFNATLRTTIAPTIINSGDKDNVLPQEATATLNLRLLPGDTVESAVSRIKSVVNDSSVEVSVVGEPSEASKTSRTDSAGWRVLRGIIAEMFPGIAQAPVLLLGMTDARHYYRISDSVYRFCPMRVGADDRNRVHGTDERISLSNFGELIFFYTSIIRKGSSEGAQT